MSNLSLKHAPWRSRALAKRAATTERDDTWLSLNCVEEVKDPIEEESPMPFRRGNPKAFILRHRLSSLKRNSHCHIRIEEVKHSAQKEGNGEEERNDDSPLRQLSKEKYASMFNRQVKVDLSHAFSMTDRYGMVTVAKEDGTPTESGLPLSGAPLSGAPLSGAHSSKGSQRDSHLRVPKSI